LQDEECFFGLCYYPGELIITEIEHWCPYRIGDILCFEDEDLRFFDTMDFDSARQQSLEKMLFLIYKPDDRGFSDINN
jgi:hypothetical protein